MKPFLIFILLLINSQSFSQTDANGNPVFNSVSTSEETVKDFQLVSNYYTLKNNIDNKGSSVFISNSPTLKEIENAAINLPSDFFMITKDGSMLNLILLQNKPVRQFFVINPNTGKQQVFPVSIEGDVTENRAKEIIKEGFDSKAKIIANQLFFNNKKIKIISNSEIRKTVFELIEKEKLSAVEGSGIKVLTKEEQRKIVLQESKEGGEFDFFTEIKGHESDGIQIKKGVYATKYSVALYQWGRANFELGVNTIGDALEFWAAMKGREANEREKDYITLGFNKELEKD